MSHAIIFINWYALFAKRLDAQLVALRILSEKETEAEGEQKPAPVCLKQPKRKS